MLRATSEGKLLVLNCSPSACQPEKYALIFALHSDGDLATWSTFIFITTDVLTYLHKHMTNNHYIKDEVLQMIFLYSFSFFFFPAAAFSFLCTCVLHPSCREKSLQLLKSFSRCNRFLYTYLCWASRQIVIYVVLKKLKFFGHICITLCAFYPTL